MDGFLVVVFELINREKLFMEMALKVVANAGFGVSVENADVEEVVFLFLGSLFIDDCLILINVKEL